MLFAAIIIGIESWKLFVITIVFATFSRFAIRIIVAVALSYVARCLGATAAFILA